MDIYRTPDERFSNLPDWPFAPHYLDIDDQQGGSLRLHYVDEGPRAAAPILLMHGEPSWAYLYRKFIPLLVAQGHRVIAPDLIGFGRSDKPLARSDYTYERHVAWMQAWLDALDLQRLTLFCQDWGGLIGLRLVAAAPARFARLVIANTALPTGEPVGEAFEQWLWYSQNVAELEIGELLNMGSTRELSDAEKAAYDAPFPEERSKAGARQFPALVPKTPNDASVAENLAAWKVLEAFTKPVLTAFSDQDPVTRGAESIIIKRMPGAAGQPHTIIKGGGHFLQEDAAEQLCSLIDAFIKATPAGVAGPDAA